MLGVSVTAVQYSSDSVNLSTENFVYDHEDIKINGEIPLSFHRYYNSKDRIKGSLGRCFVHKEEDIVDEVVEDLGEVAIGSIILGLYEVIKWGVATLLAPETVGLVGRLQVVCHREEFCE